MKWAYKYWTQDSSIRNLPFNEWQVLWDSDLQRIEHEEIHAELIWTLDHVGRALIQDLNGLDKMKYFFETTIQVPHWKAMDWLSLRKTWTQIFLDHCQENKKEASTKPAEDMMLFLLKESAQQTKTMFGLAQNHLEACCKYGWLDALTWMLESPAVLLSGQSPSPREDRHQALRLACKYNQVKCVQYLLTSPSLIEQDRHCNILQDLESQSQVAFCPAGFRECLREKNKSLSLWFINQLQLPLTEGLKKFLINRGMHDDFSHFIINAFHAKNEKEQLTWHLESSLFPKDHSLKTAKRL